MSADNADAQMRREANELRLTELEQRAKFTGNPVYVWMAIWEAHAHELPLPQWAHGQLMDWAYRIHSLAHGLDPDRPFAPKPDESEHDFSRRLHDRYQSPELDAKTALTEARKIFGGTKGKNNFIEVRTDDQKIAEIDRDDTIKSLTVGSDPLPNWLAAFVASLHAKQPKRDDRETRRVRSRARKLVRGKGKA